MWQRNIVFCAWMKKNGDTKRVDGSMEQKGSVGSVFFFVS